MIIPPLMVATSHMLSMAYLEELNIQYKCSMQIFNSSILVNGGLDASKYVKKAIVTIEQYNQIGFQDSYISNSFSFDGMLDIMCKSNKPQIISKL